MPEYEILKKTKNGDSMGFWLPVGGSYQKNLNMGLCTLAVWMAYDSEYDRFLGDMRLGPGSYHVECIHYVEKDDGTWGIHDADGSAEDIDKFLGGMGEGDRPQHFPIEGFEGEWLCVAYPFF